MSDLAAEGLSLTLGGHRILDNVSCQFRRGRVTAVLGPNGAGKSSLLACLAGIRRPDAGQVTLDGVPRERMPRNELARRVGLLPQTADVHWDIDVAMLVALGRFPHRGKADAEADRKAVVRAMAATDVARFDQRVVNSLSGGERSRALLARVLAGEPEWLLADEPLAGLDPAHQLDVLDCLRGIAAAGAGVVVVVHDLNQAANMADDVLLMRGGRVVAIGSPAEVLTSSMIADTYGVATYVVATPEGRRFIVPTGRVNPRAPVS